MEAEDEDHLFVRMAKMLRAQIEATKGGIEAMIDELSRLWAQRMDESDERIQVLEARITELEVMFSAFNPAQSSVYGSSSHQGFRSE